MQDDGGLKTTAEVALAKLKQGVGGALEEHAEHEPFVTEYERVELVG